jgi:nucleoside-diphosphate-sugar epimerase
VKVFLTGGTGFIGGQVALRLRDTLVAEGRLPEPAAA